MERLTTFTRKSYVFQKWNYFFSIRSIRLSTVLICTAILMLYHSTCTYSFAEVWYSLCTMLILYDKFVCRHISCIRTSQEWVRRPWFHYRHASGLSKAAKRLEKLGLGPDGKPLPVANYKKIYPRMYKVLMVNQDGSTYTVRHRWVTNFFSEEKILVFVGTPILENLTHDEPISTLHPILVVIVPFRGWVQCAHVQ